MGDGGWAAAVGVEAVVAVGPPIGRDDWCYCSCCVEFAADEAVDVDDLGRC